MNQFSFWYKWLFGISILFFAYFLVVSFLCGGLLYEPVIGVYNSFFWEKGAVSDETRAFQVWMNGTHGAMGSAFFLCLLFIIYHPFKKRERWAWSCLLICFLLWYLIDGVVSIYYDMISNVVVNTVGILFLTLPLFFTKKHFNCTDEKKDQ